MIPPKQQRLFTRWKRVNNKKRIDCHPREMVLWCGVYGTLCPIEFNSSSGVQCPQKRIPTTIYIPDRFYRCNVAVISFSSSGISPGLFTAPPGQRRRWFISISEPASFDDVASGCYVFRAVFSEPRAVRVGSLSSTLGGSGVTGRPTRMQILLIMATK